MRNDPVWAKAPDIAPGDGETATTAVIANTETVTTVGSTGNAINASWKRYEPCASSGKTAK